MSDFMTQEQIEEMLRNAGQFDEPAPAVDLNLDSYFTQDEQDALGEMGNICMGTAATTMYTLLGKQVVITTPHLALHTWETLAAEHPLPLVVVEVQYIEGIEGNNMLLLKEYDVALITDLLMGGEGNIDPDNVVLDEICLSAIREVMNQMVGSSATSLASMLNKTVNISTPESKRILMSDEQLSTSMPKDSMLLKISFKMEIEDVLSSEIMQVLPVDFAKQLADELLNPGSVDVTPAPAAVASPTFEVHTTAATDYMSEAPPPVPPAPPPQAAPPEQASPPQAPVQQAPYQAPPEQPYAPYPPAPPYAPYPPQYQQPYAPYPPAQQAPPPPYMGAVRNPAQMQVQEVEYPAFSVQAPGASAGGLDNENLLRLLDVPMEITVELGRAKKTIKQVLDLNVGSVIVLNKLAGEHVEILVNGIEVARGEVVVIDDNYGVRITELNAAELNMVAQKG